MAMMYSPRAWSKPAARAEVWPKLRRRRTTVTRLSMAAISPSKLKGAVAGTVIDEHQLEGLAADLHDGLQAVVEIGDVLLLIMQGNHDGILGHECLIIACSRGILPPPGVRVCSRN